MQIAVRQVLWIGRHGLAISDWTTAWPGIASQSCRRVGGDDEAPRLCRDRVFVPRPAPCWRKGKYRSTIRAPSASRRRSGAGRRPASPELPVRVQARAGWCTVISAEELATR